MKKLLASFSCVMICAFLLFSSYSFAQVKIVYDKPGSYKFKVPEGVQHLSIEAWGSGSGGNKDINAGGGGGAFAGNPLLSVKAGEEFTVIVGSGAASGSGNSGQDSSFGTIVRAKGADGAIGGKAAESLGTIRYSGGNGGKSTKNLPTGAGGGGSAGPGGNGGNGGDAVYNSGGGQGAAGIGGASGGRGGNFNTNGENGSFPGGGGGERGDNLFVQNSSGAGGHGQVIITYTPAYLAQIYSVDTGSSTWCPGEARNVSVTIKNIGTLPWTDANGKDFNIGVKWNTNNNYWKDYHIRVDAQNLQPGETKTYTFTVTASNHDGNGYTTALPAGKNNLTFDVVYEGVSWFGGNSNGVGPGNSSFTSPNQNITLPAAIADNVLNYGTAVGATANENGSASVTAPPGNYFTTVNFASYGSPSGTFPNFKINACHSLKSQTEVENRLLGNSGSVSVPATNAVFDDPCSGTGKKLFIIASHAQPVCEGTAITIEGSTPSGGNGSYTYSWESSTTSATSGFGPAAGINNQKNYTSPSLTQTTWFRRVVFSCTAIAYSNVVLVKVNPSKPASVNISASSTSICNGNEVTFTATASNGGSSPSFQWKRNGNNITGATASTYKTNSLENNDIITVVMTSNASPCLTGSPATSNQLKITVNPNLVPSVSINATATTFCAGTTVTFTANPTNGGAAPKYQWKINNVDIVGATSSVFKTSDLKNGDLVNVVMTADAIPCLNVSTVSSNTIEITVNQNLPVSVSITADKTTICSVTRVTFTATPTNGGAAPIYQWYINGIPTGQNSPIFSTSTLKDGDEVMVVLTSNASICTVGSPASSNTIKINVIPTQTATVTATANNTTICSGTKVKFTATPTHGGSAPTYQWFVNGAAVADATLPTFETAALKNGDKVTVTLKPSAQQCVSPEPVVSNTVTMSEEASVFENKKWSKGIPTRENQLSAEIREAYSTSAGAVSACSVHLTGTASVVVVPKNPLVVYNNIDVDSGTKLTVESDANLIQINDLAAANKGEIDVLRDVNLSESREQYNYLGSPVTFSANQNLKTIYPGITYVLYHNEANNFFYNSTGANIPGRGLAVKEPAKAAVPAAQKIVTAKYVGTPQNGVITFGLNNSNTATNNALGYNLLGNPYASNIDLNKLYELNGGAAAATSPDRIISSSFYLWDNVVNDIFVQQGSAYKGQAYAVFNAAAGSRGTGTAAAGKEGDGKPRKIATNIIKVGQGFMVKALQKNTTLTFNNSIRTASDSATVFMGKGISEDDRFWLTLRAPSGISSTTAVVYFAAGSPEVGVEDSESRGGSDEVFTIASGKSLTINGRESFSNNDVLTLGSRHFTAGTHTISLEKAEGIFASAQSVYLKDKFTGAITDLSQGSYTFEAQAGENTGRFEVVYKPGGVLATDAATKEEVQVYRAAGDFVVKAPKRITAIEMYDMSGRLVRSAKPNTAEYTMNSSDLANGVYLLNIKQGSEQTVKKIVK